MTPRKKSGDNPGPRGGTAEDAIPLAQDGTPYTFERALERLETIVDELEDGSLALETSIARFEEGVALTRFLERELARAQKRVEELVETAEGPATRPWEGDDAADDDGLGDEDDA